LIGGGFQVFCRAGRPESEDCITCEREDITGVAGDDARDATEVSVQELRKFFSASLSAGGESLGELGETRDIHQKNRAGTMLFKRRICLSPSRGNHAMLDSGQEARETCFSRVQVKRHGLVLV